MHQAESAFGLFLLLFLGGIALVLVWIVAGTFLW